MLTLFAGDPKLGKSYVALALAAAVSRGSPLPDSGPLDRPASVIVMSAEDDPARTIVPRLTAAGADRARIHLFDTVLLDEGREALPSLKGCTKSQDGPIIPA
jgi:putative DNA primase/helicase